MLSLVPATAFIYGTVFGSFLNVVALRTAARLAGRPSSSVLTGRSACPGCGATLRWWELVPLISFVSLRGRCARCRAPVSVQYPLVELAVGLVFMVVAARITTANWPVVLLELAVASLLVVLFIIDLKTMLLPDFFIILLSIVTAGLLVLRPVSVSQALTGLAVGAGFLFFLWAVTRGRGIGFGDVKLMVPLGALFGGWGTTVLLFAAFMAGGLVSIFLLLRQRAHLKTAIPFGPFLAAAALLLLLYPGLPQTLAPLFLPW